MSFAAIFSHAQRSSSPGSTPNQRRSIAAQGAYGTERVSDEQRVSKQLDLAALEALLELVHQPRLADPRVADDRDELREPVCQPLEAALELRELGVAADERRQLAALAAEARARAPSGRAPR